MGTIKTITLAEAQEQLGADTFIALDPKGDWGFYLQDGTICRKDKKFHQGVVMQHPGGWYLLVIQEEPSLPEDHIVGQVAVVYDPKTNRVLTRRAKGLNGEILELTPSSFSNSEGELIGQIGIEIEFNPQRLKGVAEVVSWNNSLDVDQDGWMSVLDFLKESTDGRSLAAIAKLLADGYIKLA